MPQYSSHFRLLTLLLLLAASGCETGRSWFTMSSDSPMPWFGIDLMPRRRRTTQILPSHQQGSSSSHVVSTKSALRNDSTQKSADRVWSKELRLPSIPAFFDGQEDVKLTYEGPTGPFDR